MEDIQQAGLSLEEQSTRGPYKMQSMRVLWTVDDSPGYCCGGQSGKVLWTVQDSQGEC